MEASKRKWFIRSFIPVDPDEIVGMSVEEAIEEAEHCRAMQPENKYVIVSADEDQLELSKKMEFVYSAAAPDPPA